MLPLLTSLFTVTHGRNHCYCPSSFVTFLGWGGGDKCLNQNPVIGEQAWEAPAATADGRRACTRPHSALSVTAATGIQEGPELLWAHVVNRPSSKKIGTCLTLDLTGICLFARASAMPAQTPHTFAVYVPSYLLHCLP